MKYSTFHICDVVFLLVCVKNVQKLMEKVIN